VRVAFLRRSWAVGVATLGSRRLTVRVTALGSRRLTVRVTALRSRGLAVRVTTLWRRRLLDVGGRGQGSESCDLDKGLHLDGGE
jgi:hypothetical protein